MKWLDNLKEKWAKEAKEDAEKEEMLKNHHHRIGNNTAKEVYIWHGRTATPFKHYIEYQCEVCGNYTREVHNDAIMTYEDVLAGRY